jgi:hypothetical protein
VNSWLRKPDRVRDELINVSSGEWSSVLAFPSLKLFQSGAVPLDIVYMYLRYIAPIKQSEDL